MAYPQFVLFGDSLTQMSTQQQDSGFVFNAALQHDYIRRMDVINRGFSGYNTTQCLKIFSDVIKPYTAGQSRIALMTIFLGANDSCVPDAETKQHVPLEIYRSNLEKMVKDPALTSHSPKIILVTPPPVNEYSLERFGKLAGFTRELHNAEQTKLYADTCREVGKELGVAVLDLWSVFMRDAGWKEGQSLEGSQSLPENTTLAQYLSDGLHFNAVAYKAFYKALKDVIKTHYPELASESESLPQIFPPWTEAPGLLGHK